MIKYSQIENLPVDHPLVAQFEKEQAELEQCECTCTVCEEGSLEYFDRYIAGDR